MTEKNNPLLTKLIAENLMDKVITPYLLERLQNLEDDSETDGLTELVLSQIMLLNAPTPPDIKKFKYEKKPCQIKSELKQLEKHLDNLSPEVICHLYSNGFNFQSATEALSVPYKRDKKDKNREFITKQMEFYRNRFPDITPENLIEITTIILNSIDYEAGDLDKASYNIVNDSKPS